MMLFGSFLALLSASAFAVSWISLAVVLALVGYLYWNSGEKNSDKATTQGEEVWAQSLRYVDSYMEFATSFYFVNRFGSIIRRASPSHDLVGRAHA